jgi:adenine phosphoribosyltransferase
MGTQLKKSIKSAKTIEIPQSGSKKYKFHVFDFGERGTKISTELIEEIKSGMIESIKSFSDFDYIVSPEPGGHTWGLLLASEIKKPINILRTNPSFHEGELEVPRKTGYYEHNIYFNNFKKGDKVLIVDDVVSTGGTLRTILDTLDSLSVKIIGVQVILAKSDDYNKLEKEFGIKIKFLEG